MRVVSAAVALSTLLLSSTALANSPSLAGFTGMRGATCTQCHGGGGGLPQPGVQLACPSASITAGQTMDCTVTVPAGGGKFAQFAVSANLNGVNPSGNTTYVYSKNGSTTTDQNFDEVTNKFGGTNHGGQGTQTYTFQVKAPNTNGKLKLWAVGMGASGNGTGGDAVGTTTLELTVSGATQTPQDAGGTTSDSGTTNPPTDGGGSTTTDGGSTTPGRDGGGTGNNPGGNKPGGGGDDDDDDTSFNDSGGCSTTDGAGSTLAWFVGTALTLGLFTRRRRQR